MGDALHGVSSIRLVSSDRLDKIVYRKCLADCVILAQDGRILMQERTQCWGDMAGVLNLFGGHVEVGETVMEGLLRELHEEVGAVIRPEDVRFIGALTEDFTEYQDVVHVHFWYDVEGLVTGCYEAEPRYYDDVESALAHP